jgi:integrase
VAADGGWSKMPGGRGEGVASSGNPGSSRSAGLGSSYVCAKRARSRRCAVCGKSNKPNATMILLAFRQDLRASELCSLRWEQVDLRHGRLHVSRAKNGLPSVHPLTGTELRALRRLQREQEPGRYLFMSERDAPMSPVGFRAHDGQARQGRQDAFPGASAHAAPCRRLQAGGPRRRHLIAAGLSRAQEHPAYGALYRAGPQPVP